MKNKNTISILILLMILAMMPSTFIRAQWNTNTAVNELIATVPIADMQSVPTTDGKTWVAFYHETGTNYDMRAQLFDANGYKLLGNDGVLVSNQPSGSAIFVFNVCVDQNNNLVIACQDERAGTTAVVYKISQAGAHLWPATGVILGGGLSPYPALLSTGDIAVAWNETASNTLKIQKITSGGTLAWGTPVTVQVGSSNTTRGQIIGNLGGNFTMVYQKRGVGISTTLYAQMYNSSGTALYAALQIGNLTTSGARYYSIAAEADTTYFGYYASSGSRFNSYLQKIKPDGTIPWGMNGSNFNTSIGSTDSYQMTTSIALTNGSPYVWSVCTFSNPNQTQYGVYTQKFGRGNGSRFLTDQGKVVYPISTSTDQLAGATIALVNDAPMFMNYDVDYKIYATRLDGSGNFVWPGNRIELSSTTATAGNGKMRYGFTPDGPNRCAGVWTEKRTSNYQGFAQGVSIGGLVGLTVATQGSVPATITTPGGTLQMVATVYPSTASQAVTWSIVPGTGQATVSTGGLVTAVANGTVYARAIAVQDVTVRDSLLITISNQVPLAPAVTTQPATNVVTTTATLNGTINANNNSTSASFQWGTTTSYGNTATATPATVTGSTNTPVSANISGLTVGTTYHYRCVGTNTAGTTYGNDMTFVGGCQPVGVAGTITGPNGVCINATGKVYSISPVSSATGYTWTVPAGASITAGQGTTSITVTFGSTSGNVGVYANNTCSQSNTATLAVSVNAPPVPAITGMNTVCTGSGLIQYSTEPGMTNYVWTVSSGGTISNGQGTFQIQVAWNTTGAQTVSVNYTGAYGCNATSPTSYPVNVSPIPDPAGSISGTAELCAGSTGINYYVSPIPNATAYVWTVPNGATIVNGANTESITVDFAANAVSGDITVTGNNICGNGTTSPAYAVTVNPVPTTPVITLINDTLLSSSASSGNQWYYSSTSGVQGSAITGATNQTYRPVQDGYYTCIVTLNGCSSLISNEVYYHIVGINDPSGSAFLIRPNPSDGKFIISGNNNDLFIRIINLTGETVYESEIKGKSEKEIDLGNLPEGVYFVKADNGVIRKLVIRR